MPDLKLKICRREFHVSCAAGDEGRMRQAARIVDEQHQKVRRKTKTADGERIALMTALQVAFELLAADKPATQNINALSRLHDQIDDALARTNSSLHKRALNGVNQ